MIWHSASKDEVLEELSVDKFSGLANGIADQRIEEYGLNVISSSEKTSFLKVFLTQFKNKTLIALIIISFLSFIVSLMYEEVNCFSPLLIIGIVIINAAVSAFHIMNCDKTLENIKNFTNSTVSVMRDGIVKYINASLLVPGDIILLEAGDYIPADARIIESNEFRVNENLLTGVEIPVEKNEDEILEDITVISERSNMLHSGCSVVHGTAKAVVVATGLNTEMGRTSAILQECGDDKLPLQHQLDNIGKFTNLIILVVCILTFIIGIIQNFEVGQFASMTLKMLMNSVALGVAAIPEALPAIATIVIALGTHRILQDKIIIKHAKAAELLGKTNVILCDKTGVLTHNKMQLTTVFDGKKIVDLEKEGIDESSALVIKIATACSTLENDSTENAIEKACLAYNTMSKADVANLYPHISEIPFDSERKIMTVITMINERPFAIVKGAVETVVPKCVGCNTEEILSLNQSFAEEELRVICIAMKPLFELPANPSPDDIENGLTFVGLLGLSDPPREGVIEELSACKDAGIKTVMITGDNLITARTIARRIGIFEDGALAITGEELNLMSDEELAENIERYSVFARVSPSDKTRIIKAWQSKGKNVTVTGDGVQDADALAQADVGCAIGKFGADVAKGNADIIIQNNRFGSIVYAIKQSRALFSNVRKLVNYLFSTNFAEIITILFGMLFFGSMPVAAVQLLWINLLTDSAPAISLCMEGAEKGVMKSKRIFSNKIFDKYAVFSVTSQGAFIAILTLIVFAIGKSIGGADTAATMAFAALGLMQIFHCYNNKFEGSVFQKEIFSNNLLNFSSAVAIFIILFLIFTPAGYVFGLEMLNISRFGLVLLFAILIIPFSELIKYIAKRI